MKVSDKMFEGGNILSAVTYMIGMVSAYLLNISNFTSCTKPWKLFIPTGLKVSVFHINDFSVLIIGLNSALR